MNVVLPYDPALEAYDLGPHHPLRPERFSLAVSLMRAYGLLAEDGATATTADASTPRAGVFAPRPATREQLELVHSPAYIDAVIEASAHPTTFRPRHGLGPGDTPAASGIHEAAALVCGATIAALTAVLDGSATRAFSVAGGLHHAHRDHAAGFCVYNDPAVAIAVARRVSPDLRVMYVDIDAHHGDGVQEAFYDDPSVLTLSVHESGRYLFPGTGYVRETGADAGAGFALNVPLPPYSDAACYRLVFERAIAPAARNFQPDVIVAQCGADTHVSDPLTHLALDLPGYRDLVRNIIGLADELCSCRICCTGGGGYSTFDAVPRAWTLVLAELLGIDLAEELPAAWREKCARLSGERAPETLTGERGATRSEAEAFSLTGRVLEQLERLSPLLR
ncbi:MAG: acetoin utilization protein AcuC [Actinomycetota bacterium]|nr:acetoin utilization protein AcuC [Actinomycetota bacterium]